jgi:uncharacterized membrane protein YqaE (UPF0057 family)
MVDLNEVLAVIGPPLLIWWRRTGEPEWATTLRYLLAVFLVWNAIMFAVSHQTAIRVRAERARGKSMGEISDTGANAVAFMMGWIPGVAYAAALGGGRATVLW